MNTNGHNLVEVGMKVKYRGCFGIDTPTTATLKTIELCENEHEKYGIDTNEVWAEDLHRCCVTLDDGNWAYGYQIVEIIG